MYVCMCVYIYIYMYVKKNKEAIKQGRIRRLRKPLRCLWVVLQGEVTVSANLRKASSTNNMCK